MATKRIAMTIAGSDSGGGAGIQADIKTFEANGIFATSVLTAVTAQNTTAVTMAKDLPLNLIEAQFKAVWEDFEISAVKTGMLSSAGIIERVSKLLKDLGDVPLVVDPVMISKSGYSLLKEDAVDTLRELLIPLATVITPNAQEAAALSGVEVRNVKSARAAARELAGLGARAVIIKGGHLDEEDRAVDLLFDGDSSHTFGAPRIDTKNTHGTGCTFASAIAANLAKGYDLVKAVERSKRYVTNAIERGFPFGDGHGPTDQFYYLQSIGRFPIEDL